MLVKVKPTSPGRRQLVKVVTPGLHKGKPHAALVESFQAEGGRPAGGTRRHGGPHRGVE